MALTFFWIFPLMQVIVIAGVVFGLAEGVGTTLLADLEISLTEILFSLNVNPVAVNL